METIKFEIESAKSQIDWTGRKVTGAHNGTIVVKEGNFILNDEKITGGKIVINTAAIKITDITDAATNAQFAVHLASDDFFSIEKFPTATFDITSTKQLQDNRYYLEGHLTIKDITHSTGFEAQVKTAGDELSLTGKLVIDRTKYDIKYRSGDFFKDLGDTLIYNDFDLDFTIIAKTAFKN